MRFISEEELREGDTILLAGYEEGIISDLQWTRTPFGTPWLTVRFTPVNSKIKPSTRYFGGQKIILLRRKPRKKRTVQAPSKKEHPYGGGEGRHDSWRK